MNDMVEGHLVDTSWALCRGLLLLSTRHARPLIKHHNDDDFVRVDILSSPIQYMMPCAWSIRWCTTILARQPPGRGTLCMHLQVDTKEAIPSVIKELWTLPMCGELGTKPVYRTQDEYALVDMQSCTAWPSAVYYTAWELGCIWERWSPTRPRWHLVHCLDYCSTIIHANNGSIQAFTVVGKLICMPTCRL